MKESKPAVVVIGCGGIWSYLHPPLCRMLAYTKDAPKSLVLVDGDHFTPSNQDRQDMAEDDIMKNKAIVHAQRLHRSFRELKVKPVAEFITIKNVKDVIPDGSVVVSCVDNHATRRLIAEHARTLEDCVVVTGASDMHNGNIHVQVISGRKPLSKGIDETHPEVREGKDRNPGDLSCEERARLPGGGQQIATNVFTAALMTAVLSKLFVKTEKGGALIQERPEVFYDLRHMAMDASAAGVEADVFGKPN